ncbi:MAG: carboxymuconolactone decarboxylase family protein, partial [Alphaproteobacteria bacterium]|nr:carboxymuconolactone decarboxylase family protein [Alphaproteobacteria bacterium]
MARIAYAAREDLPPALHPLVDDAASYGPFASLVGALGRRPSILEHTFGLLTALRREAVLPRRYLELALVAVSQRNACDYCVAHHGPMLAVEGMSAAGVAGLLDDPENHPELDDIDRLVVD